MNAQDRERPLKRSRGPWLAWAAALCTASGLATAAPDEVGDRLFVTEPNRGLC